MPRDLLVWQDWSLSPGHCEKQGDLLGLLPLRQAQARERRGRVGQKTTEALWT